MRTSVAPAVVGTVEDPVVFPQRPGSLDWLLGPAASQLEQDDDAFQVSVYAPTDAEPGAPVVVFLPGGGYVSGGAWSAGTMPPCSPEHAAHFGGAGGPIRRAAP
ncbi:carboxylesterase family protein [Sinomonas terrae]|uniref:Carboxylesterase family protein n=1 Tax=Sinomonas terrae TaxID=2908838 RepID=A0ABS9U088_9MICC|nr:carboxylesterase family protein [Sinomonas terrae]MCH6470089.1 carboxylesterase family protein [Sinomonas terrae]